MLDPINQERISLSSEISRLSLRTHTSNEQIIPPLPGHIAHPGSPIQGVDGGHLEMRETPLRIDTPFQTAEMIYQNGYISTGISPSISNISNERIMVNSMERLGNNPITDWLPSPLNSYHRSSPLERANRNVGIISLANQNTLNTPVASTNSPPIRIWFPYYIFECTGGEHSSDYKLKNVMVDDESVYCTRIQRNANIVLARKNNLSHCSSIPFTLKEIYIRAPREGYTSPLGNGFIFICTEKTPISAFDSYNTIDISRMIEESINISQSSIENRSDNFVNLPNTPRSLPVVPNSVISLLFFQMDKNLPTFNYKFPIPINGVKYIHLKMLNSFGNRDNIDVQFIGIQADDDAITFPFGMIK